MQLVLTQSKVSYPNPLNNILKYTAQPHFRIESSIARSNLCTLCINLPNRFAAHITSTASNIHSLMIISMSPDGGT